MNTDGGHKKNIAIVLLLLLLLITGVIWISIFGQANNTEMLEVAFLDVGQGDAIFIETPNGTQLLIDGGVDKTILRRLSEEMPFWDRSIDIVMASHPDNDHIGGLPSVLQRFNVRALLESGVYSDNGTYDALIQEASNNEIDVIRVRTGDRYILDSGIYLDIFFPDRDITDIDPNAGSIIAKLTYGDTAFLFTGDAPQAIEKYVVSLFGDNLDVDVLKLGHHGSKTSSSVELLGYTAPQFAVISTGRDNSYGHPHKEVTDRLDEFRIQYVQTATAGTIVFESDGEEVFYRK